MILSTTEHINGKKIKQILGIVKGNTVHARNIGKDVIAALKNVSGGEIEEYTKLLAEARERSIDRMINSAKQLGANAIVGIRFSTSYIMQNAAEILVYGTAVIVEDE